MINRLEVKKQMGLALFLKGKLDVLRSSNTGIQKYEQIACTE
jgi:hypothetical protein